MEPRMLSHQQAKAFNTTASVRSRTGRAFMRMSRTEALIRNGEFNKASAIFEFGCGTGNSLRDFLKDTSLSMQNTLGSI